MTAWGFVILSAAKDLWPTSGESPSPVSLIFFPSKGSVFREVISLKTSLVHQHLAETLMMEKEIDSQSRADKNNEELHPSLIDLSHEGSANIATKNRSHHHQHCL